jgi:phenylacetic acid degradation operon negative regulatory protein
VAALVRLLGALEIAPPAVRTAVSRMVRQGWLTPVALPSGPGYALTPRGVTRLDDATARVYRPAVTDWNGRWHLLVLARVPDRTSRERLRAGLAFLGYAPTSDGTWIAPRPSGELDGLLAAEGVRAERFDAVYDGDAAELVRRAWDLDALGRAYMRWNQEAVQLVAESAAAAAATADGPAADEAAFALRSALLHEWRKFLFTDPGLPRQLLPEAWPGDRAAAYFRAEAERLLPSAARFVDAALRQAPEG